MELMLNGKKIVLPLKKATVNDLLEAVGVNRETAITAVNGEIYIEEEELENGDEVKLISIISGG